MKQKAPLILAAIVALAIGGYYFYRGPAAGPGPVPAPPLIGGTPPRAGAPQTHQVSMNDNGFTANGATPGELTIRAGDTVIFTNDETRERWPASGMHPTHLLCPGFDSLKPIPPGATYSHTFAVAGECPMHDHLFPALRGKITVIE